tara:strand:- start:434 stop:580 length:147 start_codon:yes stop_codon:yes gene_type:complete
MRQRFTSRRSATCTGGGPDKLFSDKENVIKGIFKKLEEVNTEVISKAS